MRLSLTLVVAAAAAVVAVPAPSAAAPIRVTFVGDSVPASLNYTPAARRQLSRGLDVRLDLRVCRRLVLQSCAQRGRTPASALEAVRGYGSDLGRVLVVNVGYNEGPEGYREGIDRVMRAAVAGGAVGVVWVTLRELRPVYRDTNLAIRSAARRWPQLRVADWNAYSDGKPWFGADGLHLSVEGAVRLAGFLRPQVIRAAHVG